MKIKTSELTGAALDWAVAKCEEVTLSEHIDGLHSWLEHEVIGFWHVYSPSTDWSQGGPIIEQEGITVSDEGTMWSAYIRKNLFKDDGSEHWQVGPTPLIAAMRCYVASKLGNEVEIPNNLPI